MMDPRESDIDNEMLDLVDLDGSFPPPTSKSYEYHQKSSNSLTEATSGGYCVKEFENRLSRLSQENFNLKLRLYFLQEQNPNVPQGAESLYKENLDLKVELETLTKDLQEKQQLIVDSLEAIRLLEEKTTDLDYAHDRIDELTQKIATMQFEITSLETQLHEAKEANLGNDTGFTEFAGAVDGSKDRLKAEWQEKENQMSVQIQVLEGDKEMLTAKIASLRAAVENADKKSKQVEENAKEKMKKLESELMAFKDRWATTQCDLQDAEEKLKAQKAEEKKAYEMLKKTMTDLKMEREKISILENKITELDTSTGRTDSRESVKSFTQKTLEDYRQKVKVHEDRNHMLETSIKDLKKKSQNDIKNLEQVIKNQESDLMILRVQLADVKKQLKSHTTQDLNEKNRQINDLSNLMKSMQLGRASLAPRHSRVSALSGLVERISEPFNELEFHQAMLQKKISQEKINSLIKQLAATTSNTATKEHVKDLQDQLNIFVEKQSITDSSLERYTEICNMTFSHLSELAQFLAMLIKKESIRSSLEDTTICQIQNVLDRTMEFSQRMSMDNRMSIENISLLEVLMDSTRMSIANIQEIKTLNVSMQTTDDCEVKKLRDELVSLTSVNQLLEDEIVELKKTVASKSEENAIADQVFKEIAKSNEDQREEIKAQKIKADKLQQELNDKIAETKKMVEEFEEKIHDLEIKLQQETVKKIKSIDDAARNEKKALIANERLEKLLADVNANMIPKVTHIAEIEQLQQDLMSNEAQIAAIRMELDEKLGEIEDLRLYKENEKPRRTLEISEDRMKLILGNSSVSNVAVIAPITPSKESQESQENVNKTPENPQDVDMCPQCPVLRAKVEGYKKYLQRALSKLKTYEDVKKLQDRLIQGQLSKTTTFLKKVTTNMENIAEGNVKK